MATYVQLDAENDGPFYRVVNGTQGNDSLNGFPPADPPLIVGYRPLDSHFPQDELFYGFGGNDRIFGRDGYDVIHGGNGKDIVNGGSGFDQLFGEGGNDFLTDPDVASMSGNGGNDIMRMTVSGNGAVYYTGGDMTGGSGADQFRATLVRVADIDDVNYGGPSSQATIHDFHAGQGDKILFQAKLATGEALSGQAVFNLLDTNNDDKLDEHDGSTAKGRVTYDGDSAYENEDSTLGNLHLQLGQGELEVAHVAQLTAQDFVF